MSRRQFSILFAGISFTVLLGACGSNASSGPNKSNGSESTPSMSPPQTEMTSSDRTTLSGVGPGGEAAAEPDSPEIAIVVTIGAVRFPATLADTDTARAFADRLPLTLDMADVNSNEKAFDLPDALPSDPDDPGAIHAGELMLYGSNTIVLFYESFDTTYTYTRIGCLDASDGLPEALGTSGVTVTFANE